MKYVGLVLSVAALSTNAQYGNWECNHFGIYPMDVCIGWTSSIDYYYTCNSTDFAFELSYESGECGDEDPTWAYAYDLRDDIWSDYAECGYEESCDYYEITCDGINTFTFPIGVCIEGSSVSSMYTCSGSELTTYVWSNDDCSGGADTDATFDYADIYTDDCYEFTCSGTGSGPVSDESSDDSSSFALSTADWECNHIYNYPLPLDCLSAGGYSISAQCDDDETVTLYEYMNGDCSGDPAYMNTTTIGDDDPVKCSFSSSCPYFGYEAYNDTTDDDDCSSGNLIQSQVLIVDECYSYSEFDYSFNYECSSDTAFTANEYNCGDCSDDCLVNSTTLSIDTAPPGWCIDAECVLDPDTDTSGEDGETGTEGETEDGETEDGETTSSGGTSGNDSGTNSIYKTNVFKVVLLCLFVMVVLFI